MDFLSEEVIKAHDELNGKMRKDMFRLKLKAVVRDSLFNSEIDLKEMKYWLALIDDVKTPIKRKVDTLT